MLIIRAGPTGICTLLCVMLKQLKRIIVCEKSEERRVYVLDAWKCLHDCEACGKCRILK